MNAPFDFSNLEHATGAAEAPPGAPRGGVSPGLVLSKTSHTPHSETVEVDPNRSRMRRMYQSVRWAACLFDHTLKRLGYKTAMLTLTYREVDGWNAKHISELQTHVRNWLGRKGHAYFYVWVAELQKRGAMHYHVLIWLPRGLSLPKPDKQGWWPHGHTRIEFARSPVGYLCKYASKFDSKVGIPEGARLHGSSRARDEFSKAVRRWVRLPSWLQALAGIGSHFVRVQGLGLVEKATGVCVQSPWWVCCRAGRVEATRVFEYLGGMKGVAGPYSMLPGVSLI